MGARILIPIAAFLLAACTSRPPKVLSREAYRAHVADATTGLSTVIESGVWRYRIQYRPAAYIALSENPGADGHALQVRTAQLTKTAWFNVSISLKDAQIDPLKYGATLTEYNTRLAYFLNEASKNFRLTYGDRTSMKQIGYHFENYYNIKPEVVAVVGFEIPDETPSQDMELEYDDELFNAGILKFKLFADQLAALPKLSI